MGKKSRKNLKASRNVKAEKKERRKKKKRMVRICIVHAFTFSDHTIWLGEHKTYVCKMVSITHILVSIANNMVSRKHVLVSGG